MENKKTETASTKKLISVSMVFFMSFILSSVLLRFLLSLTPLIFLISSLISSYLTIKIFMRLYGRPPVKKEKLRMSNLCILFIALMQIPIILSDSEFMEEIPSALDGVLLVLLSGGMTLVIFCIFIRISLDFFGALEGKKYKKKNDTNQ